MDPAATGAAASVRTAGGGLQWSRWRRGAHGGVPAGHQVARVHGQQGRQQAQEPEQLQGGRRGPVRHQRVQLAHEAPRWQVPDQALELADCRQELRVPVQACTPPPTRLTRIREQGLGQRYVSQVNAGHRRAH